ncbi:hypothetical protein BSZ39_06070 [Bowdeniella nasicola]|uniref:Uncharacterized protein n=2 Tax=Bowdeniella nasicola TaxID=208480 RepID=A0A1Q5Q2K2_9ACTO|nr:hypothetical protein BSZ39_06070 [Bowdeniella nasicola]
MVNNVYMTLDPVTTTLRPDMNTMTLVHRASRGTLAWWRSVVLYEYSAEAATHAEAAIDCVADVTRLGADGVVIPSGAQPISSADAAAIVSAHHEAGLKVVPSLSPSRGKDGLLEDAQTWLAAGADGIDLRSALAVDHDLATGPFHALLAEHLDDGLLSGAMRERDDVADHLAEDWLGHIRDDSLTDAPWDADEIRDSITRTFATRDALGASPAWTTTYALYRRGPSGTSWQANDHSPNRVRATALMVMALPGACYLLQGEEVGLRDWSLDQAPAERAQRVRAAQLEQEFDPTSMFEHYRRSLHLRRGHRLGTGTVAWIDGAHRADGTLELLNRCLLTVLNTSSRPVALPEAVNLVHASTDIRRLSDGRLVLPSDAAAMIELPPFAGSEEV